MTADYTMHSGWGDHISWFSVNWETVNINADTLTVCGHLGRRPRVGQTLLAEFQKSYIKFEFVEVDYCADPPDMFFAKVRAISQEMK